MDNEENWALICDESGKYETRKTHCMRVPGGRLYRYEVQTPVSQDSTQIAVAMVVVPTRRAATSKVRRRPA